MKSMTKKITATALFGVLAVSAFAGCGGAGGGALDCYRTAGHHTGCTGYSARVGGQPVR